MKFNSKKYNYPVELAKENGKRKQNPAYSIWGVMHRRCYSENYLMRQPTYVGCEVREDWHDYQEFADFYHRDVYRRDGWALDKDYLVEGNKIYSIDTCVFVPQELNNFILSGGDKNNILPGVTYYPKYATYRAQGRDEQGKRKHLIYSDSIEECFYAFKKNKEDRALNLAKKYEGKVHPAVFEKLYNYRVSKEFGDIV